MEYAQSLIKQKGFFKSCLDVETHEKWIRKFYESLGYEFVSGIHELKYKIKIGNQNKKFIEQVNYFEKEL